MKTILDGWTLAVFLMCLDDLDVILDETFILTYYHATTLWLYFSIFFYFEIWGQLRLYRLFVLVVQKENAKSDMPVVSSKDKHCRLCPKLRLASRLWKHGMPIQDGMASVCFKVQHSLAGPSTNATGQDDKGSYCARDRKKYSRARHPLKFGRRC